MLCRGMYTAVASRTTLSAHLTDAQRGSLSGQDFTVVLVGVAANLAPIWYNPTLL